MNPTAANGASATGHRRPVEPGDRSTRRPCARSGGDGSGTHADGSDGDARSRACDVRILRRDEAAHIEPSAWDELAERARYPNPFYERWNLLPALRHLEPDADVRVVTAYLGTELVGLFPVCVKRILSQRYLKIWCYRDCLLSDVLLRPGFSLWPVLQTAMERLGALVTNSPMHGRNGFDVRPARQLCRFRHERRAITRFDGWDAYEARLSRKDRKENRRILRRVLEREGLRYETSDSELLERWLPRYLEVENSSWKMGRGNAISVDENRSRYFEEAIAAGEAQRKVQFQGLFDDDYPVAMSFRFTARSHAYEIKTSYRETHRRLYPGVVLELLNLRDILDHEELSLVDSCAFRNRVVDRIWPDEIPILNSMAFAETVAGRTAGTLMRLYLAASHGGDCRQPPWAR